MLRKLYIDNAFVSIMQWKQDIYQAAPFSHTKVDAVTERNEKS